MIDIFNKNNKKDFISYKNKIKSLYNKVQVKSLEYKSSDSIYADGLQSHLLSVTYNPEVLSLSPNTSNVKLIKKEYKDYKVKFHSWKKIEKLSNDIDKKINYLYDLRTLFYNSNINNKIKFIDKINSVMGKTFKFDIKGLNKRVRFLNKEIYNIKLAYDINSSISSRIKKAKELIDKLDKVYLNRQYLIKEYNSLQKFGSNYDVDSYKETFEKFMSKYDSFISIYTINKSVVNLNSSIYKMKSDMRISHRDMCLAYNAIEQGYKSIIDSKLKDINVSVGHFEKRSDKIINLIKLSYKSCLNKAFDKAASFRDKAGELKAEFENEVSRVLDVKIRLRRSKNIIIDYAVELNNRYGTQLFSVKSKIKKLDSCDDSLILKSQLENIEKDIKYLYDNTSSMDIIDKSEMIYRIYNDLKDLNKEINSNAQSL